MIGIILIQVLLQLIAIVYIYRISKLVFGTSGLSLLAASIYAILPSGLFHPHVLVTEAFFNPLIVISFFYGMKYLTNIESPKIRYLLISAIVGSFASFIRLIYILYPIIFVGIIFLLKKPLGSYKIYHIGSYLIMSFLIPLLWASYMFVQTGNFSMGESRHDFKFNLYGRINRMSQIVNIEPALEKKDHRLEVSEYVNYVFTYPTIFLKTLSSDVSNMALNSGINSLLGRYLELYKMSNTKKSYWHNILDKDGMWELAKAMYTHSPLMLVVNVLILPLWFIFLALSIFGGYVVVTNNKLLPDVRFVLILLPTYLFLTSQTSASVRWGFRTPFEFILVILFVAAVSWFLERYKETKKLI
jgi:hypothetical protein